MERDIKKFPEKALEFAETVMKLFRASQETNLVFQRQTILNKDCLDEMDQLIKALHGLQRFKISGINIRLGDYMKVSQFIGLKGCHLTSLRVLGTQQCD